MASAITLATGWQVGTRFFKNKHLAIEYAHLNPQLSYKTYWLDHEWDQHDWTIEPKEELAELERAHCRWLREKFPILVLAYSGGVDSHTVLHRFLEQGIHLDYIITTIQPEIGNNITNKEFYIARNYIQNILRFLPGTKLLTNNPSVELKQYHGNGLLNTKNKLENLNHIQRFHHIGYSDRFKLHHPAVYDKMQANGGAIIVGSNKPQIVHNETGYWCQFTDKTDENITSDVEYFWSGSNVALQIKQCHMAVKWLKDNPYYTSEEIYKRQDKQVFMAFNRSFGRIDPIDEIFTRKNCFNSKTTGIFSQEYGQNCYIWAKLLELQETQKYLDSIHNELLLRSQEAPRFYGSDTDIFGWLTKPRFLCH